MASQNFPSRQVSRSNKLFLLLTGFILVVSLTLLISSARAQAATTLDEYWQKVKNTQALLGRLQGLPEEDILDSLQVEAIHWESISAVILLNNEIVPIDSSYLVALLGAQPPDITSIENFLDSLLTAKESMVASGNKNQTKDALSKILARPEYQWSEAEPIPLPEPIQNFMDWLKRVLSDLLSTLLDLGFSIGVNFPTIISAIILAYIIYSVIRGTFTNIISEANLLEVDEEGQVISANGALRKAQDLSSGGDYRTAVRYLYLSALLLLEDRGLLNYDHSKTNHEYIRSLANHPELATSLRAVVEVFDGVWYGFRPIDAEGYDKYAKRVISLGEPK